jgi:biopolymer transport protein ExbB
MVVRHRGRSRRVWVRLAPSLLGFVALAVVGAATMARAQAPASAPAPVPQVTPGPQAAPAPTDTALAPAATPPAGTVMFLVDLFRKGGPVMWVLAACSVLALAVIFERLHALRRSRVIPPNFLPGLRVVWGPSAADRDRSLAYCRANDSPMGRMVAAFLKRLPRGLPAAEKAVEDAGATEALRLRANLRPFYAIGSVATLLGLIGTIAGMIDAFIQTAGAQADGVDRVQLLSSGIYAAMVCTFGGLAVAILVTSFYYYFVGRVETLIVAVNDELTTFADEFVGDDVRTSDAVGAAPTAGR